MEFVVYSTSAIKCKRQWKATPERPSMASWTTHECWDGFEFDRTLSSERFSAERLRISVLASKNSEEEHEAIESAGRPTSGAAALASETAAGWYQARRFRRRKFSPVAFTAQTGSPAASLRAEVRIHRATFGVAGAVCSSGSQSKTEQFSPAVPEPFARTKTNTFHLVR